MSPRCPTALRPAASLLQSEWEEEDGLWEDEEAEEEPQEEEEEEEEGQDGTEPEEAAPSAAAAAQGDEPASVAGPAGGDASGEGCCKPLAEAGVGEEQAQQQQDEAEDESSNTAALGGGAGQADDDGADAAEGAENVPPAEEPQPRYDAIGHSMLKVGACLIGTLKGGTCRIGLHSHVSPLCRPSRVQHLLLLQAEASCTLSGLQEAADCAQDSLIDLRAVSRGSRGTAWSATCAPPSPYKASSRRPWCPPAGDGGALRGH